MIQQIHDALRSQGLVPPAEDIHFTACSTDYRTKMREALSEFDDIADLKRRIEELEGELDSEQKENRELESALDNSRDDFANAEKELGDKNRLIQQLNDQIDDMQKAQVSA